jgi:PAP2 superfamily protein
MVPAFTHRLRRPHPELLFFLGAYLLYLGARWAFAGDPSTAREHAGSIVALERSTHIAVEASVQRAFDADATSWVLSNVYLAAQLVVLPGTLIALYRWARPIYRRLRATVLVTWMIAVPIYGLWPVAPPRLAGLGIEDTVSDQLVELSGHSTIFYNAFAAVPSLHVGFAFAVSLAIAAAVRHRWVKALALLWGPLVTLAVVATGNHFLFDAAAGLVVTLAGFAAGTLLPRVARRRTGPRPVLVAT